MIEGSGGSRRPIRAEEEAEGTGSELEATGRTGNGTEELCEESEAAAAAAAATRRELRVDLFEIVGSASGIHRLRSEARERAQRELENTVKRCARRTRRSRRIGLVSTRNRAECVLVEERRRIEAYIVDIARYGRSRARSASISKRKRRRSRGSERKCSPKKESRHTPSQVDFLAKGQVLEAGDLST